MLSTLASPDEKSFLEIIISPDIMTHLQCLLVWRTDETYSISSHTLRIRQQLLAIPLHLLRFIYLLHLSSCEPFMPTLEQYSRDLGTCGHFLLQYSLVFDQQHTTYSSDKVTF